MLLKNSNSSEKKTVNFSLKNLKKKDKKKEKKIKLISQKCYAQTLFQLSTFNTSISQDRHKHHTAQTQKRTFMDTYLFACLSILRNKTRFKSCKNSTRFYYYLIQRVSRCERAIKLLSQHLGLHKHRNLISLELDHLINN